MNQEKAAFDGVIVLMYGVVAFLLIAIAFTVYFQNQRSVSVTPAVTASTSNSVQVVGNSAQDSVEETTREAEEVVIEPLPAAPELPKPDGFSTYVEVVDSCGPYYEGECLRIRSGPGTDFPVVSQVRTGIVLKVESEQVVDGQRWYKIEFDEWLRYPERVTQDWYVAADFVQKFYDIGVETEVASSAVTSGVKTITVDRSEQMLYAYEDDELFMEESISTGLELSPTPRGSFTIFRKTPTRYMQGPLQYLAMSKYYDLPGVPWNLYFTQQGAVIHGAYWHDSFGQKYSSGCVNMRPLQARVLYEWAEIGTTVVVRD